MLTLKWAGITSSTTNGNLRGGQRRAIKYRLQGSLSQLVLTLFRQAQETKQFGHHVRRQELPRPLSPASQTKKLRFPTTAGAAAITKVFIFVMNSFIFAALKRSKRSRPMICANIYSAHPALDCSTRSMPRASIASACVSGVLRQFILSFLLGWLYVGRAVRNMEKGNCENAKLATWMHTLRR